MGGSREETADVRILSATNKDLAGAVSSRTFRLDLYHRLNVGKVIVPPLRERRGDILMLASHFISAGHAADTANGSGGSRPRQSSCSRPLPGPGMSGS